MELLPELLLALPDLELDGLDARLDDLLDLLEGDTFLSFPLEDLALELLLSEVLGLAEEDGLLEGEVASPLLVPDLGEVPLYPEFLSDMVLLLLLTPDLSECLLYILDLLLLVLLASSDRIPDLPPLFKTEEGVLVATFEVVGP
jgi:hypothetical protein